MAIILDCKGEPCPNPVLRCKQVLDAQSPQNMQVVVDNDAAKENVSRFLVSKGMRIDDMRKEGGLWTISASKASGGSQDADSTSAPQPSTGACPVCAPKILVFITRDVIGQGDDTLGGVRLATASNPAVEHLKKLEAAGVSILVCGTCLEFFKLMDQKAAGEVTNMLDVVTSQQVADKVITI
jgi:TusA-related sulfurtransferase